jgi:hypothetical protein
VKALAALAREREADQAAPVFGHEVDAVGTHVVGREHQIAFVLAIFFIDQDDHAAGCQLGNEVGNRGHRHAPDCRWGRLDACRAGMTGRPCLGGN